MESQRNSQQPHSVIADPTPPPNGHGPEGPSPGDPAGGDAMPLQGTDQLGIGADDVRPAMEAILMAADGPVTDADFARVLGCTPQEAVRQLEALRDEYDAAGRGFELRLTAGGWQYASRAQYEGVVSQFVLDGSTARLSQAALEALAIIAYKQPVTRAQVSAIRGVNSDGVVRFLTVRGLIRQVGVDEDTRAALLGTSGMFLDYMGITSLAELPPLAPFLPADVAAEIAADGNPLPTAPETAENPAA